MRRSVRNIRSECLMESFMFRRIRQLDYKVTDSITIIHCRFLDTLMVHSTYAGTGALIWWITLAIPFVCFAEYRKVGVILIIAIGFNYLLGEIIIKNLVGRGRPSNLIDDNELKIDKPKDHSFPSGHTASSFCAFTVTFLNCQPAIWIPALAAACLISFSRIYLRVHYLSDVIGGVVLGIFNGALVSVIFNPILNF